MTNPLQLEGVRRFTGFLLTIGPLMALLWWFSFDTEPAIVDATVDGRLSQASPAAEVDLPTRHAADGLPDAAPADAPSKSRDFEAVYVDILAAIARDKASQSGQAPPSGPTEKVKTGDLFREMVVDVKDSGHLALSKAAGLPNPWNHESSQIHVFVCRAIIDLQLQVMTDKPDEVPGRTPLVAALLEHMPFSRDLAALAHGLLNKKRYLDQSHEPILKAMLDGATGDQAYLRPLVLDLLLTLWLHADTSNADLLALAEGSEGPTLRLAALQRLLLSDKYRSLALEKLIDSGDPQAMDEAAMFAARNLTGQAAIDVVMALRSTPETENRPFGAYRILGERDPEGLARSYEECLANATLPAHRMNAMMTLGRLPGARGEDLALTALRADPSHRVRGVALLALSSRLATDRFAPLFDAALADVEFTGSPFGYSDLVNSLANHARVKKGDANFLDRGSSALLAVLPTKHADLRAKLEDLRKHYLPR